MPESDIASPRSAHTFHIPVMGTGFTVDTPLKVARYGISSVISLVDDVLIEQMREHHSTLAGEPFEPITAAHPDPRAARITAYLNLVGRLVARQSAALQASPFEPGSEITRYFELLPESPLKQAYRGMLALDDPEERRRMEDLLRPLAVPGSIDVNMITKIRGDKYHDGQKLPPEYGDSACAVRGFALSDLQSSIVFSAGLNQPIYTYLAEFKDFLPDARGTLKKKIVLKVSDYRSAEVQGRFLAKRGLWVSEYRIESGLNCGGHAFFSRGQLLGPVLEELRGKREGLLAELHETLCRTLEAQGLYVPSAPFDVRFTVQGGIGTASENDFLLKYYAMDGTGWGTPFLLVPEVTNMDAPHRELLLQADSRDVYLSDSSPLGVPFWNLRQSASERKRRQRIREGRPGSPCKRGYAAWNTEFSVAPLCTASNTYQKLKLDELKQSGLSGAAYDEAEAHVLAKSCICHDLAGNATLAHGIDPSAKPAVCCGPNIAFFTRLATLEEMAGHIYGRLNLLAGTVRPHMFLQELRLNLDYLRHEVEKLPLPSLPEPPRHIKETIENLLSGIRYYHNLVLNATIEQPARFLSELGALREGLLKLRLALAA